MVKRRFVSMVLVLGVLGATSASALAKPSGDGRPPDGLYASRADPNLDYSNGGVDLQVASGGRKIVFPSGVACYTGTNPPAGVPAEDEVSINIPRSVTIAGNGSFSFGGPVTISAEDAQAEAPIKTTYKIQGRFKKAGHGTYEAVGTDSSPICQPSTRKRFTLIFDPAG
jgi:hypothetical protein